MMSEEMAGMSDQEVLNSLRAMEALAPLLKWHFGGDFAVVKSWCDLKNPLLGGQTPHEMIHAGRSEKLLKFIMNTLVENAPLYRSEEDIKILGLDCGQIYKLKNYYELHSGNPAESI